MESIGINLTWKANRDDGMMTDEGQLRSEIRWLGALLGDTVKTLEGSPTLELIEQIRELSKLRRKGDQDAETKLLAKIESLSPAEITSLIRAFSIFFDLANLAEDRHRARVLRQRESASVDTPRSESISAAILNIKSHGTTSAEVEQLLQRLDIEPVFTAHPTEAKRRSIREKIRDFREHLNALDNSNLSRREVEQLQRELKTDLILLWRTDFLRERRPTVLEELERSLFFFENLWQVTPELYRQLSGALENAYPDQTFQLPTFLKFGTWIGGDRDGNPNVTAETSLQAMERLRSFVLLHHHRQCRVLRRRLSLSESLSPLGADILEHLNAATLRWPQLHEFLAPIAPHETARQYLRMIQWRIEQTQASEWIAPPKDGAYTTSSQLSEEIKRLRESLNQSPAGQQLVYQLDDWLTQVAVFGFHAMRLDIRQESGWYREVLHELLKQLDIVEDYRELSEEKKQATLGQTMLSYLPIEPLQCSPQTQETWQLFRLLAETVKRGQSAALGLHIISMTQYPSDVLGVMWLGARAAMAAGLPDPLQIMPIVPLFETIEDLRRSDQSLNELLANPTYKNQLLKSGSRQSVMIGYSDSTKDGGYLAAAWEQYRAQVAMSRVALEQGIRISFFHGRGGALGRGGGPAARAVLSSPPEIINGAMRVTEQGEVMSARYDDPEIASRHLEQIVSATLQVSVSQTDAPDPQWLEWMEQLASSGLSAYRELVEHPAFLDYFEWATPISEIEQLPIGSRPARRGGQRTLHRLRAIPWVFSWTQNRHILPAWFGTGTALAQFEQNHQDGMQPLGEMYRKWPFFEGLIENAALALAKADLSIGAQYAQMIPPELDGQAIWQKIIADYQTSCRLVLAIVQREHLMAHIPWLNDSIARRNPYVDPLNLAQVKLLKQYRSAELDENEAASLRELIRMSIQGIAAGLRTTG